MQIPDLCLLVDTSIDQKVDLQEFKTNPIAGINFLLVLVFVYMEVIVLVKAVPMYGHITYPCRSWRFISVVYPLHCRRVCLHS